MITQEDINQVCSQEVQDKHDIIYEVIDEFISSVEKGVSEFFNSDEFKMDLRERLKERGVEIKFKDYKNTKLIGNIEIDKYEIYFGEELYETIKEDLVIV